MIIGQDIMRDLSMDVKFSTENIKSDDAEVPLRDVDTTEDESFHIQDFPAVEDTVQRFDPFWTLKYEPADLIIFLNEFANWLTISKQGRATRIAASVRSL